jgi:hypothetical protein
MLLYAVSQGCIFEGKREESERKDLVGTMYIPLLTDRVVGIASWMGIQGLETSASQLVF